MRGDRRRKAVRVAMALPPQRIESILLPFGWSGVVLDNLREGVLVPDIYDPTLNPLYRDVLAHYGPPH